MAVCAWYLPSYTSRQTDTFLSSMYGIPVVKIPVWDTKLHLMHFQGCKGQSGEGRPAGVRKQQQQQQQQQQQNICEAPFQGPQFIYCTHYSLK